VTGLYGFDEVFKHERGMIRVQSTPSPKPEIDNLAPAVPAGAAEMIPIGDDYRRAWRALLIPAKLKLGLTVAIEIRAARSSDARCAKYSRRTWPCAVRRTT
jgi:hypothetical protein